MKDALINARILILMLLAIVPPGFAIAQEGWPVRFSIGEENYQLFAPQPESMNGNRFTARAAISMQRAQDAQPVFGAIWGDGKLELDRGSRLGRLIEFKVTDARFPGVDDTQELARLRQALSEAIPANAPPISMDWLVAALEEEQQASDQYVNDPPEIIYRDTPSALVFIDGDPLYEQLDATVPAGGDPLYNPRSQERIDRVVNTPFMILRLQNGAHYLHGSGMWFRSRSLDGPWQRDDNVPQELVRIADHFDESAALTTDDRPSRQTPEIIIRYAPAELIDVAGAPDLQPVQSTSLLTLTNTSRSIFMDIATQDYYFLASGRWFRSKDLRNGPWTFVPADKLPEEFRKIPEGSNRDVVLAHVAGTDAAREAARDASIPQTARVDRNNVDLRVTYEGAPTFERIQSTNVEYALNANTDVLRINGRYHVCDNGVWYEGSTPDGPWQVSTQVPEEVQSIPPSSPVYNVRYVYIYDHTPDVVYVGYTPGYLGSFVQHGVVIYGTGFYYQPWGGFWRPRPWTWGWNMYYDPWFGWGMGWGWGYGWVYPGWAMWRPYPYAWGWWGPYAWHPPCCYQPTNTVYGHRPSLTGGGRSGRSASQDVGRMAMSDDLYASTDRAGVTPTRVDRASAKAEQAATPVRQRGTSDHFTDAAGNVYRLDGDRTQRYENGGWSRLPGPEAPAGRAPTEQRQRPTRDQQTGHDRPIASPGSDRPIDQQTPSRTRSTEPYRIQRDRQRGIERQRSFEQRSPTRPPVKVTPRGGSRPSGVSPGRSPGRSPGGSVSPGGGGRSGGGSSPAPSRGGGGRNR